MHADRSTVDLVVQRLKRTEKRLSSGGLGRTVFMQHSKFTLEEELFVVPPPRLSAGGLLETARLYEHHGLH
jgi:hypothetical protein